MCGRMSVQAEVWPIAADSAGLWLLSGSDAWRSGPIPQDGDVHFEVENLLTDNALLDSALIIHSTSWRPDGPFVTLTYVAVVANEAAPVLDRWPAAKPISLQLADMVGPPGTNAATDPPIPRYVDVLLHAIRHLCFLRDEDATVAQNLDSTWRRHLEALRPALAGMYSQLHSEPAENGAPQS